MAFAFLWYCLCSHVQTAPVTSIFLTTPPIHRKLRSVQVVEDALTRPKEGTEEDYYLQSALDASQKAVTEGSMYALQDFCQLLDNDLGILVKLRELIIDWVQEGFQDFFRKLDDRFLLLPGKTNLTSQDRGLTEET